MKSGGGFAQGKFFRAFGIAAITGFITFLFSGSVFSWFLAVIIFYYKFFVQE